LKNPRRVALVLETSGGGSGRHVLDLARGLNECDHAVTVIYSPVRAEPSFVESLNQIDGIRVVELQMYRTVGFHDWESLRSLEQCLKTFGPFEIIHGHSSKAGALVRLLPKSVPGTRLYTPHAFRTMDPNLGGLARLIYGGIERLLAQNSAHTIAVSQREREHALSLGFPPSAVTVIINGVTPRPTLSRLTARSEMSLQAGEVAVGFVGRLTEQKDPLRFIEAFRLAANECPGLVGVVIGDGQLRSVAQAAAEAAPIRFLGWRDGPALMAGLDIFCMTSRYEAMPYTLLEAIMAGVPVVTSDVGGVKEAVVDGETGAVLPLAANAANFAEKIILIAKSDSERQRMSDNSRALARKRTVETMVGATVNLYAGF
jgi:glycosyltransferase involved in cell wall biosynthesis